MSLNAFRDTGEEFYVTGIQIFVKKKERICSFTFSIVGVHHVWQMAIVYNGWRKEGILYPLPGLNRAPERGWGNFSSPELSTQCMLHTWMGLQQNPQWGLRDTEEIVKNQPRAGMCSWIYTHTFNKKFTLPFTICHLFGLYCLLWALQARVCFPHMWYSWKVFTSSFFAVSIRQ